MLANKFKVEKVPGRGWSSRHQAPLGICHRRSDWNATTTNLTSDLPPE